jgi:hypothetical protein
MNHEINTTLSFFSKERTCAKKEKIICFSFSIGFLFVKKKKCCVTFTEDKKMTVKEEISAKDKALFEAGIKLGALYHQFIGTPVSTETARVLETAIEKSVSLQPGVSAVEVKIDREKVRKRENENQFGYCALSGEMLDVKVAVRYEEVEVHARVKYEEEMGYPLMRIEKVT